MPYIKRIVKAGDTIEVKKYFSSRYGKKENFKRESKVNITSKKMEEINERNAVEKLTWLINANFGEGDLHCRLTYADDYYPTEDEAKENIRKFLRKLRKIYRENGMELKYVNATEYEDKRIHHHVLVNEINPKIIQRLWEFGRVFFTPLDDKGDYTRLAVYFVKETRKTFKVNPISAKRWNASKNLRKPSITKVVVSADSWTKNPVALKGYYIPSDSIEMDVDCFGYPYQKYTMIKIPEKKGIRNGKYRSYNGAAYG